MQINDDGQEIFTVDRLNALTDGVFAIVVTLLVLELKLPDNTQDVASTVVEDNHVFVAWLISFLAIARFWILHHEITSHLKQCHLGTLVLNMLVLAVVSLMPFSADVIGAQSTLGTWSIVMFAANLALLSISVGLLARHALNEPALRFADRRLDRLLWHRDHLLIRLPAVVTAAIILAFFLPKVAIAVLIGEFIVIAVIEIRKR